MRNAAEGQNEFHNFKFKSTFHSLGQRQVYGSLMSETNNKKKF